MTGMLALLVAGILATSVTTTASTDKELEHAVKFRESVGFVSDPQKVKEIARHSTNDSKKMFGVELTDAEFEELNFRSEMSKDTKGIKDAAKNDRIEGYSGVYIDQKTGTVNVGLVHDNQSTKENVKALFPHKERLRFFKTTFTLEQLEAKQALLDQENQRLQSQGVPLQSWGVSIKDNRLEVELDKEATSEQIQLLKDVVGEEYLKVVFAETEMEPFASRSDYTRPLQAGLQLTIDKVGLNNPICTTGYSAVDNNGVDGIITAGHCTSVSASTYQPTLSSTYSVGSVSRTTDGSMYADAAWIPTTKVSGVIYGGVNVKYSQYGWEDNPGDLVIKSGNASSLSAGELSSVNRTVNLTNGKTYYGQRVALAYATEGDSGAPVYKSITGGANAVGILITGGTYSGGQSYFVYTHISQVYSELSVYGVYTN